MFDEDDELEMSQGTKCYSAPEMFENKSFKGRPADIWAAGVTFY